MFDILRAEFTCDDVKRWTTTFTLPPGVEVAMCGEMALTSLGLVLDAAYMKPAPEQPLPRQKLVRIITCDKQRPYLAWAFQASLDLKLTTLQHRRTAHTTWHRQ